MLTDYPTRWAFAQLSLSIWNPALMDFIREPARRRQKRLYYRAKGIVCHDRVLRGVDPLPEVPKESPDAQS